MGLSAAALINKHLSNLSLPHVTLKYNTLTNEHHFVTRQRNF